MAVILRTEGLNKDYRLGGFGRAKIITALDDVNINVESDRPVIISVVGESGSGKTTLAKTLLRLVEPSAGRAIVYDKVVAGKGAQPSKRDFMKSVQPIFQNPFEAFSRYRPVDAYLFETADRVAGLQAKEAEASVDHALVAVGLDLADVRGKYSNQFSGGELQRISIARALIPDPSLIVADEPVSMIDASRRMIIINLFKRLRDEQGRSFLYITHDLATAYYISDFVAVMNKGRVVEFGAARDVMGNPQHDYTRLLLSSIPTTRSRWRPRSRIAG
ncbi:ABC transporter ATP-binding protein [Devosia rhodophyticola]|uniref:ABC transporter ATP-binding protein n=1 Tax=Devosia rhodophyticola TaxID=3026423 RepID=A0ABY7YXG8_9HYPH|nr:ABC transporter ATP-binding protein [Devosia rhodophyticola]WDR06011.1 ABC transporter ATP-binding protein [Devosia rhodophyticola]